MFALKSICLAITIAAFCILLLFKKRVTHIAGIIILILSSVPFEIVCLCDSDFVIALMPTIFIIAWLIFKIKFNSYDYSKRILSFAYDKSVKKDGKVLGNCFPYYSKQLKLNNSKIKLSSLAASGGIIMTGSTGSGKTYGILNMIKQDIEAGKNVVFIDFKGELDTAYEIEEMGIECECEIYKFSPTECFCSYDPLTSLSNDGKVEAIMNMRKWSIDGADAHYKTGVQVFLQKAIKEYQHEDGSNWLYGFYNFLQTYNVEKQHYDAYNTVLKLLELTLGSEIGKAFTENKQERFKFKSNNQYVMIASFTSATKSLGTAITSLMFQDIMESGVKEKYDPKLHLYIDEFGSCENTTIVRDILEKGRSLGVCTCLAMQDLNQLIINTSAPFVDSVLGTVNSFIIYSGATRQTAEKLSGVQIYEIDDLLMSLRKPVNGKPPTAIFISKYPIFGDGGTEVYRFIPCTKKEAKLKSNETLKQKSNKDAREDLHETIDIKDNISFNINQNTEIQQENIIDYNDFI